MEGCEKPEADRPAVSTEAPPSLRPMGGDLTEVGGPSGSKGRSLDEGYRCESGPGDFQSWVPLSLASADWFPRSRKGERLCLHPLRCQGYGAKRLPINAVEMDCKSSKGPPHHSHEEEVLGAQSQPNLSVIILEFLMLELRVSPMFPEFIS